MNKDVMLKVKIDEARITKYFQPVITNNTVIIPAKRLQDDISETTDKSPVYKNITDEKEEKNKPKYKNLVDDNRAISSETIAPVSNEQKQQDSSEEKIEELQIEEIIIEEVKEQKPNNEFKMKLEDMARIFEENQKREVEKLINNTSVEEDKVKEQDTSINESFKEDKTQENSVNTSPVQEEQTQESSMNKDVTTKMDLPYEEGMKTESIPQRRDMVDNLNEMKSKLFLLASNAKKPVRICVNKKVFLMGSDYAKMDCVIRNNRYISRCHAKIYYEASCYFIEDVGSMNGTFINGVKLAEGIKYKLETGDIINLADCRFEVDIKN